MADPNALEVGDRLKNPSQARGKTFEVVDIREEQTFTGEETVFVVRRVSNQTDELMGLDGDGTVIHEREHDRWKVDN